MSDYKVADPVSENITKVLGNLDTLTQQILVNRGITDSKTAAALLAPDYEAHLHDPWLLHDMEKAVVRILRAIKSEEKIIIFSDYDCDGIPGAVVLHDFFTAIGFSNFTNYIPHRHYEGFGLSTTAVEKLHKEGAKLIITIDCGTSDHEAIHLAKTLGMEVIVTDHHEPKAELPEAIAIVNPKIGDTYPFPDLCGAGVVFKLVQALIEKGTEQKQFELIPGFEKWWLDMVGIATIADMVPLVGENRVLAHYGLQVLRKSRRPGLQQLLRAQRASQRHLTEDDIGFTIGPRINAASRMDTPEDAFFMLAETDEAAAGARVEHLELLNNERKGLVAAMTKEIHKRLKDSVEIPAVLVLGNPDWRPSLVGLAANKLAEEYNRPVFLWGRDGNQIIKGSCRSDGTTSLVRLMEAATGHFLEHGGHHFSGGFSVIEDQIHTLSQALNQAFVDLGNEAAVVEALVVDAELRLDDVRSETLATLQRLAPYGVGNPKPLFAFKDVVPEVVELFGKGKEHVKLKLTTTGVAREAIAFFKTPESFARPPAAAAPCTILGHLEQSYFMNRLQTRIRIVDIV